MDRNIGLSSGIFAMAAAMGCCPESCAPAVSHGENSVAVIQGGGIRGSSRTEVRRRGGFLIIEQRGAEENKATIIQHE